ncbi:MAG: tetratricopeptide repeat protein [Candidatus Gastranaerophilales bacterium]|nr:tetratricopeptide repeat protein [Candidatus Gastranaerophilales bacterium]
MKTQGFVNFYNNCAITNMNSNPVISNPNFTASLNEQVNTIDSFWQSQEYISQKQAESLKQAGNNQLQNNQYKKAIQLYKRAIELKPDYADAYFNLAKAYNSDGNKEKAILTYEELLKISPNDVEALTNLGECYKETNNLNEARKYYQKALDIDPRYDLAKRSIKEIENQFLAKTSPKTAKEELNKQSAENLEKARNLVMTYCPESITKDLEGITLQFGETNSMSGHPNIAQYENDKKTITVTNKYIWAAPEVIAAYLTHEAVHAKDRDPYSSIKEEQDAYRESVKFWLAHNNGIKDPEMDYASSLYLINPANLDEKVKEVYSTRDSSIPQYSPNHGIAAYGLEKNSDNSVFSKIKNFFSSLFSKPAQITPQFNYDQGLLYGQSR